MSRLYKRKRSPHWVYDSSFRGKRLRISTGMRQKIHAQKVQCEWDMKLFKGDLSFIKNTIQMQNNVDAFMDEYLKVRSRVSSNTANTANSVLNRFKRFLKQEGICSKIVDFGLFVPLEQEGNDPKNGFWYFSAFGTRRK